MVVNETLVTDFVEVNTHLTVYKTQNESKYFDFDVAELKTECGAKVRLTSDDIKSLCRILNSNEFIRVMSEEG